MLPVQSEPAEQSPAPTPSSPNVIDSVSFAFHGTGSAFFALMLKNILLSILSIGIYVPWARTERRKYLWQNVEVQGHRLRYHGTGKELFIGYLKVLAGYALFLGIPALVQRMFGVMAGTVTQGLLGLALLSVVPYAIWGSRRYLLSRTSWRGVHFHLEGGSGAYARTFFGGLLLTVITFGFYGPIWANRLYRISVEQSALGTQRFTYTGEDGVVWRMAMKGWLLSLLTLGIYYFWYRAALSRYQMQCTGFAGARGQLALSGGGLLMLVVLQLFGLTLTLGLAFPWIATYMLSYTLERLRFVGPIDLGRVYQADATGDAAADGLADALDVGVAL